MAVSFIAIISACPLTFQKMYTPLGSLFQGHALDTYLYLFSPASFKAIRMYVIAFMANLNPSGVLT